MTLVLLGATLADRPALSMRNLAIAALVVLALEPESLLGPSFQMSFGAVAALIALFERHGAALPEPESWVLAGWVRPDSGGGPGRCRSGLCRAVHCAKQTSSRRRVLTTLVAEAATAPFGLYHFQRFTPYGLVGNALTLPLVSFVVMPAAVLGVIAIPFGLDAPVWRSWAWRAGHARVSSMVAGWKGSVRTVPAFGAGALLLLSLATLCATLWRSAAQARGHSARAWRHGARIAAAPSRICRYPGRSEPSRSRRPMAACHARPASGLSWSNNGCALMATARTATDPSLLHTDRAATRPDASLVCRTDVRWPRC